MPANTPHSLDNDWLRDFYKECGREITLAYTTLNQMKNWAIVVLAPMLAALVATGTSTQAASTPGKPVKQRRDQHIAHLDRRVLLGSQESQAVDAADLHVVFDTVEGIGMELGAARVELSRVQRFSWAHVSALTGPEGLDDFLYFTRAAFDEVAIPSPNAGIEKARELDRILRRVRSEFSAPDGSGDDSDRDG